MRKILIYTLLAILIVSQLTSCVTEKACSKFWTTQVKDSVYVHDTTIIRDTVIRIEERTTEIHDTVPCDDFSLNKDSGGVKIVIRVKDRIISAKCACAALELKLRLYDKVRTISKTRELTKIVTLKQKNKSWWIWLLVGIGIGFFVPKIIKAYTKVPFL